MNDEAEIRFIESHSEGSGRNQCLGSIFEQACFDFGSDAGTIEF